MADLSKGGAVVAGEASESDEDADVTASTNAKVSLINLLLLND